MSCIFATLVAFALTGCEPPVPVLGVDRASLEFTATDEGFPVAISSENGDLEWTVDSDEPWLAVDLTSGTGAGQINVSIDRSQLDPSQESTGTIRIRAGEQEVVITVNAVSAFTPVNTAYFPMAVGNSWTYSLGALASVLPGLDVSELRLQVADRFEVAGLEVWQVDLSLPELLTGVPLFKGAGIDDFTGGELSLETYWVFINSTWYVSTSLDVVDALPSTELMIPLASLMQLPSTLSYLEAAGLLERATNEITGILATAQQDITNNSTALNAYVQRLYDGDTTEFFALTRAFGTEFSNYSQSDPVLNALVHLMADTSTGLEPMYDFLLNVSYLLSDFAQEFYSLQEPPISLMYWTAWDAEFGTYQNTDPLVETMVQLISHLILEFSEQYEALLNYTPEELDAYSTVLYELVQVGEANAGLLLADRAAFIDALQAFATTYPALNAPAQSAVAVSLRILSDIEAALPVLEQHMVFPLDTAGLSDFIVDATQFNAEYLQTYGPDPAAAFVGVLLRGAGPLVEELAIVAPTLNTIAADYATFVALAETQLATRFDLDAISAVLGDFERFFGTYRTSNGDALADLLRIVSHAGGGTLDAISRIFNEAENAPYEDVAGSLSALLPDTPFRITLNAFGIANQSDCISPRILVETDEGTLHIASTIYARDIGPVLLAFLPLQYGEVNGVAIGTPPLP